MAEPRGFLDSVIDFADRAMDGAEQVTGARVVETKAGTGSSTQPRSRFRIVEGAEATAEGDRPAWIVTDGDQTAVCNSAQFAKRVLDGLG